MENAPIFEKEYPHVDTLDIKELVKDLLNSMTEEDHAEYQARVKLDELRYIEEWEAYLRQRYTGENPVRPD